MHMNTINSIRARRIIRQLSVAILFALALAGCGVTTTSEATQIPMFPTAIPQGSPLPTFGGLPADTPNAQQTTAPVVATNIPATATPLPPTAVPTLDANWSNIRPGIDYRRLSFTNSSGQGVGILVARIDPARATFRVSYVPGQVKSINDWLISLPGAAAIINANYFDTSNNPLGLATVDGAQYGSLLPRADAGLFQVVNGAPKVRSLFLEPYGPGEHFDQVIQGYPMLMVMGQPAPAFDRTLNNVPATRTVIAQDIHGRILFMVTSPGLASFTDIAHWLATSGLEIDAALNLDGGQSTTMYLATGGPSSITPGIRPVPVVLAVYPR